MQVLRLPDVCKIVGLRRSAIYAAIKRGEFPRPIRLTSQHAVGWRADEISAWLKSRPLAGGSQ